jgi:hypothetical protein
MLSPGSSPLMRPLIPGRAWSPGPGKHTFANTPESLVPKIVRALAPSPPPMLDEPEQGDVSADTSVGKGTTTSGSMPITTGEPVSGTTDSGRAAYAGATRVVQNYFPRVSPSSSSSSPGNSRPSSCTSSATAVVQPYSPPSMAASPWAASAPSMPMLPDPAPAQPVVHRLVDDTRGVDSPTGQVGTKREPVLQERRIRVRPREGASSANAAMACVYDVLDTLQVLTFMLAYLPHGAPPCACASSCPPYS